MHMKKSEITMIILFVITLIVCFTLLTINHIPPFDFRKPQEMIILYTSDLRGYIEPCG